MDDTKVLYGAAAEDRTSNVVSHETSLEKLRFFLGGKGLAWIALAVFSSMMLVFVEYLIASFLQLFLAKIGLASEETLPGYLEPLMRLEIEGISLFLVGIGLMRAVATFWSLQSAFIFMELMNTRLRLFTAFEILLAKRNHAVSASEINYRFGEVFPKTGQFFQNVCSTGVVAVQLVFLAIGMLLLAWRESVICLLGIACIGLIVRNVNKRVTKIAIEVPRHQAAIIKLIERVTRNQIFIFTSGTGKLEFGSLASRVLSHYRNLVKARSLIGLASGLPPFLGIILLSAVILLSQKVFLTKAAVLVGFLYLFIRFIQQLGAAVNTWGLSLSMFPQARESFQIMHSKLAGAERAKALAVANGMDQGVAEVLKAKNAMQGNDRQDAGPVSAPAVRFENVHYAWPGSLQPTLKGITFDIKAGTCQGIIGPSGVGKSTLLYLALGVLEPNSGIVHVNAITPTAYLEKFGKWVGYVGPEPFLIEGTIKDNLLYGNEREVSDEDLYEALTFSRMDNAVRKMKGGLNYFLHEDHAGLSTGQKQRLSIARAILRKPKFLILDEASANLDNETESEIASALRELKNECTVLIVSHRAGILRYADNTITLS